MDSRAMTILVVLLLWVVVLGDGVRGGLNLTREEEEDIERQLKLINKLPIKTLKSKDGDIIDCIDINKQPAFDHPLLKNHTYQRRPCSYPNGSDDEHMLSVAFSMVELDTVRCPLGTIPIKRTAKEDLMRFKSFLKFRGKNFTNAYPQNYTPVTGAHWAILQSNIAKYHGAKGWLSQSSILQVNVLQYSGASITLLNGMDGPNDNVNVIMVGWMVHPQLYGDSKSRLTIFWTTDGYQKVICYNHRCPGFIQTNPKYTLGSVGSRTDENHYLPLFVYKDKVTGHWWLAIGNEELPIGYWPKYIFTSLDGEATSIQWGGFVFSPTWQKSPPMGNGHFPHDYPADVIRIHFVDDNNQLQNPKGNEPLIADMPDCYKTSGLSYSNGVSQWNFGYGGPGGC